MLGLYVVQIPVEGEKNFCLSYNQPLKDSIWHDIYNLGGIFCKGGPSISSSCLSFEA